MWKKLKKTAFKCVLWCLYIFCYSLYKISLKTSWFVEEWQFKNGFKDRWEKKYSNEDITIFAMLIPDWTPLKLPDVKNFYSHAELSKEHIYKIIESRRYANTHKPEYINFIRSEYLRKLYPETYG